MIDLKAIRAAAEAATPGPWEAAGPSFGAPLPKYLNEVGRINEDEMFEEVCVSPSPEDDACSADMNYIATANPATVIALLDRLEAAEKDAARYRWVTANHVDHETRLIASTICQYIPHRGKDATDAAIDALMKDEQK